MTEGSRRARNRNRNRSPTIPPFKPGEAASARSTLNFCFSSSRRQRRRYNFCEPWIRTQRVENRIDVELQTKPVRFIDCLGQPGEGLLVIPEPKVSHDIIPGRQIFTAPGLFLQPFKLFFRQRLQGSIETGRCKCFLENFRELCASG